MGVNNELTRNFQDFFSHLIDGCLLCKCYRGHSDMVIRARAVRPFYLVSMPVEVKDPKRLMYHLSWIHKV